MTKSVESIFEKLDPSNLVDYYGLEFKFGEQTISVDLNFDQQTINPNRLEIVRDFLNKLETYDNLNKEYIKREYIDESSDITATYLKYFIEDNDAEIIKSLIKSYGDGRNIESLLLDKFRLNRLAFFVDNDNGFANFDYTISKELTGDIIVVFTDTNGQIDYITMES